MLEQCQAQREEWTPPPSLLDRGSSSHWPCLGHMPSQKPIRGALGGQVWVRCRPGGGGVVPGPPEPQELDHPRVRMWHREATPWCSPHEESEPPGRGRIITAIAAKHCPRLLSHALQVGTVTTPKSYRGVKVECMQTAPITGLLTCARDVSQCPGTLSGCGGRVN